MRRSTFALPALIAIATLAGLLSALTGDGWRDALSWVGLGLPVATVGWAIRHRRTAPHPRGANPPLVKGTISS